MKINGIEVGPQSPLLTQARARRLLQPDESDVQAMALEALVGKAAKGERRAPGGGLSGKYPELSLLYAINPNKGGQRSKAARGRSKAMGLLPDMPDFHLPVMRGPFIGLYVEVKRERASYATKEQKAMHAVLREEGHCVIVAQGVEATVAAVLGYLHLPLNRPSARPLGRLAGTKIVDAIAAWRVQCHGFITGEVSMRNDRSAPTGLRSKEEAP